MAFLILKKISFSKQADCNLTTSFSGPKSSRDFRETGPWDRSQKPLSMRDSFPPSMFQNGGQQMIFSHVFQLLTRPFVDLFKF